MYMLDAERRIWFVGSRETVVMPSNQIGAESPRCEQILHTTAVDCILASSGFHVRKDGETVELSSTHPIGKH